MSIYMCTVCDFEYNEAEEVIPWEKVPEDWLCPVCDSPKSYYRKVSTEDLSREDEKGNESSSASSSDYSRESDSVEQYMSDIHAMAESGTSVIEPMRTKKPVISWDDVLIKGGQLAKRPLDHEDTVEMKTIIGPKASKPMVIETPIYVSHMSFGALSLEAKTALALGSAAVKTATCSGEGGILPEEKNAAYKYIFEYVPNKYSVTDENLKSVDAIEIKFGQSSKPGMGGHLPGKKVTEEISKLRGFKPGTDIISPSHFREINSRDDLKNMVDSLREKSEGRPIGIKLAAGNIEDDLEFAVYGEPDFITFDGRPGGTGASPKFVKAATSIPTLFALHRARKFLDEKKLKHISLIITGGLRVSSDFAKALALGADAVAVASAAMMAVGCQQWRMCSTGKCPMGIATQEPELRARFNIEQSAKWIENYLKVCSKELEDFTRLTGNSNIHDLSVNDLCTTNSEISNHTNIKHV